MKLLEIMKGAAQLSVLCFYICSSHAQMPGDTINMAGRWECTLLDAPDSMQCKYEVSLPGTLDTNGVGKTVPLGNCTTNLARRVEYTGRARYVNEVAIPASWQGKKIFLTLERTRPARVEVDGIFAGEQTLLSSEQVYDLTELVSPGKHIIAVTVDNGESIPKAVRDSSHACVESTQTNWNGITGNILLTARNPEYLDAVRIVTSAKDKEVRIDGVAYNPQTFKGLKVAVRSSAGGMAQTAVDEAGGPFSVALNLPNDAPLWSEWAPNLISVEISLQDSDGNTLDKKTRRVGLRDFKAEGTQFTINGEKTFLRGRHDACVWPLTGYAPTDKESWVEYFAVLKQYGLNHVRFHSWCPPAACFDAADEAGMYLQPELSLWGEVDKDNPMLLQFLKDDMEGVIKAYGHHPSFVMFAVGNELWGEVDVMREFIDEAREIQPDLLATFGSNIYLGWQGHIEGEDFLVTCRVGAGEGFSSHARASFSFADADEGGILNSWYPGTQYDFSSAVAKSPVPVIGHETGQYQTYPDYTIIDKFTGVTRADNLAEWKRRAEESGVLRKARHYFESSGKWAAKLYKADMEMNLRTPGMGGFQLLDLQDYPGQGTALVGILDPFMMPKGSVTPEEWRQSCNDLVVLAEMPGYCFYSGDIFNLVVKVANYTGRAIEDAEIKWELPFFNGSKVAELKPGLNEILMQEVMAPELGKPEKAALKLDIAGMGLRNEYPLWLYPRVSESAKKGEEVKLTKHISDAISLLEKGERVILMPDSAEVAATTEGPLFTTDYWNYRMFKTICESVNKPVSPGTMGLLIDARHPVFDYFPTEESTDWQWFPAVAHSRPLIIDRLPASVDPIVEVIDNGDRAQRMGLIMEFSVGKGKLLLIMSDLGKASEHPEGAWLLESAKRYAASSKFRPALTLTPGQLEKLLTVPSTRRSLQDLHNISY